jgi:hypothetical protein
MRQQRNEIKSNLNAIKRGKKSQMGAGRGRRRNQGEGKAHAWLVAAAAAHRPVVVVEHVGGHLMGEELG